MPTYRYTALDPLGNTVRGRLQAPGEAEAREELEEHGGLAVTSLRVPLLSREWGSRAPRSESVLLFTRTTASLLGSLTLQEALEVVRADLGDAAMERVLRDVSVQVRRWRPLADALAAHPAVFGGVYVAAVRSGERASLREVMRMLATSQRRARETRRQVTRGLAYPATILGVGGLVSLVILYAVVPRFARAVADAGAEAPLIMRVMLGASQLLTAAGPALLAALLLGGWLGAQAYRSREGLRARVDGALLRLPVLGVLLQQAALAGWARLFAILYASGTPVASGVEMAAHAVGNRALRRQLAEVSRGHAHGRPLWREMGRVGLPPVAGKLVRVGEEGGRLGEMLGELAEHYEEETAHAVERLTRTLEPMAIVVIMVPVALLVGGVYALMSASMQAVAG